MIAALTINATAQPMVIVRYRPDRKNSVMTKLFASHGGGAWKGQVKERWMCKQAAIEQDPEKLVSLIKEINDLLDAKEKRLQDDRAKTPLKTD